MAVRRTLLAMSVAVIAVCIVSMHQLSSGHTLATADPAPRDHPVAMLAMTVEAPADLNLGSAVAAPPTWMTSDGDGGGCPSCAPHVMLMAACLLAFTLVVVRWLLRSPASRSVAWTRARSTSIVETGLVRVRPALSLVELSLRRT